MWHIILIGYVFVTLMFSIAQPSLPRMVIYLIFWTILPTAFAFYVAITRRRNRFMKLQEQQELQELQNQLKQKTPETDI